VWNWGWIACTASLQLLEWFLSWQLPRYPPIEPEKKCGDIRIRRSVTRSGMIDIWKPFATSCAYSNCVHNNSRRLSRSYIYADVRPQDALIAIGTDRRKYINDFPCRHFKSFIVMSKVPVSWRQITASVQVASGCRFRQDRLFSDSSAAARHW